MLPRWPSLGFPLNSAWPGFRPFDLRPGRLPLLPESPRNEPVLESGLTPCSSSPFFEQPSCALGLGCNFQNRCLYVHFMCCSLPSSEQISSAVSLGCNSLVQGPSILAACRFSPPFEQLPGASSPGCNCLDQGPGILIACCFSLSSKQLLSAVPLA